ncbi:MAG: ABC transporter ATP-binding protein [[Ruminococcus] gnavus]|nr:ABC transporter ATP-binding protein [Mediterraneibacter gnavus]
MGHLLEVRDVTKIYEGGVLANHNVNFTVDEGEIHALVGENGAGKSTLMKMLYGLESITSGHVYLNGEELKFQSSKDAIAHGIGMVHQHFMLVDSLTGAENMMLGLKKTSFVSNRKRDIQITNEVAKKYNFEIDASKKVRDMSVGMKQKLEILKILYRSAKLIILDEPTAVLTPQETEELFEKLLDLKKRGMTIIFISHKLNEVKRISDRITVLKNGVTKGTYLTKDVSEEEISNLMVGREVSLEYDKEPVKVGETVLKVENLVYVDKFKIPKISKVNFEVHKGEIVGIAGVEGNGQSELISIVTGNMRAMKGNVYLNGKDISRESVTNIRKYGMSHVPEDRMIDGCAPEMSVQENLTVSNIDSFANRFGMIQKSKIKEFCKEQIREFMVKTKDENQAIGSLSGGNIQKAIIAREFKAQSDLLVLNQPTRGVDIGAISFIHSKILEMRKEKKAVLLVSADLNELISLSDRILVMYKGKIVGELDNSTKVTEQELGLYMLGLKKQEEIG